MPPSSRGHLSTLTCRISTLPPSKTSPNPGDVPCISKVWSWSSQISSSESPPCYLSWKYSYLSNSDLPLGRIKADTLPTEEFELNSLQTALRSLKESGAKRIAWHTEQHNKDEIFSSQDKDWLDYKGNLVKIDEITSNHPRASARQQTYIRWLNSSSNATSVMLSEFQ